MSYYLCVLSSWQSAVKLFVNQYQIVMINGLKANIEIKIEIWFDRSNISLMMLLILELLMSQRWESILQQRMPIPRDALRRRSYRRQVLGRANASPLANTTEFCFVNLIGFYSSLKLLWFMHLSFLLVLFFQLFFTFFFGLQWREAVEFLQGCFHSQFGSWDCPQILVLRSCMRNIGSLPIAFFAISCNVYIVFVVILRISSYSYFYILIPLNNIR